MSLFPYIALWLILIVAGLFNLFIRQRSTHLIALLIMPLLLLAWIFFRPDAAGDGASLAVAGWTFKVNQIAWGLTGVTLLAGLLALVDAWLDERPERPVWLPGVIPLLVAVTLLIIWAADSYTRLVFLVVWFVALLAIGNRRGQRGGRRPNILPGLLASIFLFWLAAITRPPFSLSVTLLAAILLLGIWPLHQWRETLAAMNPGRLPLLLALPVIIGASVIGQLQPGLAVATPALLLATALSFFSMLAGFIYLWSSPRPEEQAGVALSGSLAGLVLLAGLWAGVGALIAAVQLAVFVPMVLSLLPITGRPLAPTILVPEPAQSGSRQRTSGIDLRIIPMVGVYLAMAGLPFLAGFKVLSSLYQAWQAGGWILVIVMVILLTLWLAAVIVLIRRLLAGSLKHPGPIDLGYILILLPLVGLINIDVAGLAATGWLTWLLLAIAPFAGLIVGRFMPEAERLAELIQESLKVNLPEAWRTRLAAAAKGAGDALGEAIMILEGDYGVLWLAGLLLLIFWIA